MMGMTGGTLAIETTDLTRTYRARRKPNTFTETGPVPVVRELVALDNVSLQVHSGELFGLLGPNGAGKTTLLKILSTLLLPSQGSARVLGFDVASQAEKIRPLINMVSGGESSGYGLLTVRENLWLFSQLYGIPGPIARQRIDELLRVVGLSDRANTKTSQLSTGLRQKMNFCRGFVTDPQVLFLDEPTLGLDVNAARTIRTFVRSWLAERPGRTLVLTTHYMREADELCDRIAIIDQGKVCACDTPAQLKRLVHRHPRFTVLLDSQGGQQVRAVVEALPGVHRCEARFVPESNEQDEGVLLELVLEREEIIGAVVQAVVTTGTHVRALRNLEPSLEDVFVQLVGHGLQEEPT